MSSEIGGEGIILAAVALPAGVAYGAGWLAWKSGKLLVDAGMSVIREVNETKERVEQERLQRYQDAVAEHERMTAMCSSMLEQLDMSTISDRRSLEMMKGQLRRLCSEPIPEDCTRLENMNMLALEQLERIVEQHTALQSMYVEIPGRYEGLSVADLMDDLRLSASAAKVRQTLGTNVCAVDADSWERGILDQRFERLHGRIVDALRFVANYARECGVSKANHAWFGSCFNGINERLASLSAPGVSNEELKRGIRSLEETMDRFETIRPSLEKEKRRMYALYDAYREAAAALGEKVYRMRHFKCAAALEEALAQLNKRSERASYCAAIYQQLGPAAYMCYAWDEELKAMGYAVQTRKEIAQMALYKPERAMLGQKKMPFYRWNEESLTQIYEIAPQCSLQLIVNSDGSITMQTIVSDGDRGQARKAQKQHCEDMKLLHQRLLENWFISYDGQEHVSADHINTVTAWRMDQENWWCKQSAEQTRTRREEREDSRREVSRQELRRMQ